MADFPCPNCGQVQPQGGRECPNCQIVFDKWAQCRRQTAQPQTPLPPPRPHRPLSVKLLQVLPRFAALTSVPVGLWLYFRAPPGLPLPEPAHAEPAYHFAIGSPSDWELSVPKGVPDAEYSHVLTLKKDSGKPRPLELRIVVTPHSASKLGRNVGERVRALFDAVFIAHESGACIQESMSQVEVDRLSALRVDGGSRQNVKVKRSVWVEPLFDVPRRLAPTETPSPRAELREVEDNEERACFFRIYVVPGAERSYLLGFMGDKESLAGRGAEIDALAGSFRVTRRYLSGGHLLRIFHGELVQELVLLLLGWVLGVYGWVFSPLRE